MCLCYLFSAKTAWQLVNRTADFFYKTNRFESIRISNRICSNRELECSTPRTCSVVCTLSDISCVGGRISAHTERFSRLLLAEFCAKNATNGKKAGRTGEWDSLQALEITYGGICDCELALGHVTLLSLPRPSIAQCCAIAHAHSLAFSVVRDFLRCLNGDCCRLFRPFQERVAARKCCQTTVKRQTYMVGWQSLWMTIWNEQGRSLLTSVLLCIVVASILCFGVDLQCRSFCVFSVFTLSVSRYLQLAGSISVMREVRKWYFLQRNSLVCTLVLC